MPELEITTPYLPTTCDRDIVISSPVILSMQILDKLYRSYIIRHYGFTLNQVSRFIRLASLLKRDIKLPQPLKQAHDDEPPRFPPSSVVAFLAGAIGIPETAVVNAWKVLKHEVWEYGSPDEVHAEDEQLFREHGWQYGLSTS